MSGNGKSGVNGVGNGASSSTRTTRIPRYQGMYSTGTRNISGPNSLATLKTGSTNANTPSFGNLQEGKGPGINMTSSTSRLGGKPNSLPNSTSRLGTKPNNIATSASRLGITNTKTSLAVSSKSGQSKAAGVPVKPSVIQRNKPTPHPSTSRLGTTIRRTSDSGLTSNKTNVSKSTAPKTGTRSGLYAPRMTKRETTSFGATGPIHKGSSRRTSQTSLVGTSGQSGSSLPINSSNSSLVSTVSQVSQRTPNSGLLGENVPTISSHSSALSSTSMRTRNKDLPEHNSVPEDRNDTFVLPLLSPRSNDRPSSSQAGRSADSRLIQTLSAPRPTSSSMQETPPVQSPVLPLRNPATYSRRSGGTTPSLVPARNPPIVPRVPSLEDVSLAVRLSSNSPPTPSPVSFQSSPVRVSGTRTLDTGISSELAPIRSSGVIRSTHAAVTSLQNPPDNQPEFNPLSSSLGIRRASTPVVLSTLLTPPPSHERRQSSDAQTSAQGATTTAASASLHTTLGNHAAPIEPNSSVDARPNRRTSNHELLYTSRPSHASNSVSALPNSSSRAQLTPTHSSLSVSHSRLSPSRSVTSTQVETTTAASASLHSTLGNRPAPIEPNSSVDARPNRRTSNHDLLYTSRPSHASYSVSALPSLSSRAQLTPSHSPLSVSHSRLSPSRSVTPSQDEAYAVSLMEEEMASIEQEDERLAQRLSTELNTETLSNGDDTPSDTSTDVPTLSGLSSRRVEDPSLEDRRLQSHQFLRVLLSLMQDFDATEDTGASEGATAAPTNPIRSLLQRMSRGRESNDTTATDGETNSDTLVLNSGSSLEDYMRRPMFLLLFLLQNQGRESSANHAIENNDYEFLWDLAEQIGEVKKKGLTMEDISKIPSREFIGSADELGEQCRVCLTDYEVEEKLRILPCQHEFHLKCIDQWLLRNATCPICRHSMVKS